MRIHEKFNNIVGGEWRKAEQMERWYSEEHKFSIYRSSKTIAPGKTKLCYRRSDTMEIIYYPAERKGC